MKGETMTTHDADSTDLFGFWLYILSDCILFSAIFATFAVLHANVYGGPGVKELTNTHYILFETLALLTSSFTFGLAILAMYQHRTKELKRWLVITILLGLAFISMELNEFYQLFMEGHTYQSSAALSAFFTLVGTHGLHVTIGLIWMILLLLQLTMFGLNASITRRLTFLGLFWAFLDIVWIFVFTIVYLMEAI